MVFDRAKAIFELKKIQAALAKETVEGEAGGGAVRVTMNGEQKVRGVQLDREHIDLENLAQLEKWLESAISQAVTRSQQLAAEKMKSVSGGLGLPGL